MQITSLRTCLRAALAAFLIVAACATSASAATATLVEVWTVGDDGYTLRLRDAMEAAFRSSPDFTLSGGQKPGTLVVQIPTNVAWKNVGRRTKVLYNVEFKAVDGTKISADTGSCWDNSFAKCAAHIVKDARIIARKTH
jgi:hypothetical protein